MPKGVATWHYQNTREKGKSQEKWQMSWNETETAKKTWEFHKGLLGEWRKMQTFTTFDPV